MSDKPSPPKVNHYNLFADGIEAPLRYGINRFLKYSDVGLTDAQIGSLIEKLEHELTNWFCETYDLGDE